MKAYRTGKETREREFDSSRRRRTWKWTSFPSVSRAMNEMSTSEAPVVNSIRRNAHCTTAVAIAWSWWILESTADQEVQPAFLSAGRTPVHLCLPQSALRTGFATERGQQEASSLHVHELWSAQRSSAPLLPAPAFRRLGAKSESNPQKTCHL